MGKRLAESLRQWRAAKRLSVRQLSKAAGIAHTSYAAYEQGIAAPPDARREALATALGVKRGAIDEVIEQDTLDSILHELHLSDEGKATVREFIRFIQKKEQS